MSRLFLFLLSLRQKVRQRVIDYAAFIDPRFTVHGKDHLKVIITDPGQWSKLTLDCFLLFH
jgi:hypothetical protein